MSTLPYNNPYGLGLVGFRASPELSYTLINRILQAYIHNPATEEGVREYIEFNFIEPKYTGDWEDDVEDRIETHLGALNHGDDPMVYMQKHLYNIKRRLDRFIKFLKDNELMVRDEHGIGWCLYFNRQHSTVAPTAEQLVEMNGSSLNGGVFGNTTMSNTFGNTQPAYISPTTRIRTQPSPNRSNERVGVKELAIRKAAIRGGVLTNRNRRYIESIQQENPPFKVNNPDSYNYLDVITHIPVQRRTGDLSSHAYMVNQMIKHAYEDNHITLPKLTDITEDWEFDADSPREAYEEALQLIPFHNNLLDLNKNKKKR